MKKFIVEYHCEIWVCIFLAAIVSSCVMFGIGSSLSKYAWSFENGWDTKMLVAAQNVASAGFTTFFLGMLWLVLGGMLMFDLADRWSKK